jgi:hypothetical protein
VINSSLLFVYANVVHGKNVFKKLAGEEIFERCPFTRNYIIEINE